jgi:YidC/Oxa1 family membrane protein insertase
MFNKNFFLAFLLILATFLFFNSDLYNYTLLKKERPSPVSSVNKENSTKYTETKSSATEYNSTPLSVVDSSVKNVLDSLKSHSRTITVYNGLYKAKFSTLGGIATSWEVLNFKKWDGETYNLISDSGAGIFNLSIADQNFDNVLFDIDSPDSVSVTSETTLVFRGKSLNGKNVEKIFTFKTGAYDVKAVVKSDYLLNEKYQFGWLGGINESEKEIDTKLADAAIVFYLGGDVDDVDRPIKNDDTAKAEEGDIKWVSLRSKYFSGTLVPEKAGDFTVYTRKLPQTKKSKNPFNFSVTFESRLEGGNTQFQVILIPSKHSILKSYDIKLDKILFQGYSWFFKADIWFPKLCGLVVTLLNYFYDLIPNYGVSILLLTLLMKLVTLPLTIKSTKSMARMKTMAPKIKGIQEKFKGDPMAQQQAMMKMYKEEGVSPLGGAGGCLPMILQMPIFIALFVSLRKAIELRGAPFAFWIHDLSAPEIMLALPFNIPFFGAHLSLLNIIMAISMFFQSKMTMTGNDPNQKMMVYFMPIMMFVMFNNMPAGLLLYWSLSNILGIAQNYFIKFDPEELKKEGAKKKKSIWGKKPSYNEILKRMGKK